MNFMGDSVAKSKETEKMLVWLIFTENFGSMGFFDGTEL